MSNDLVSAADVATYLDDPVDETDQRLLAAVDDAWSAVSTYLRFDPATLDAGDWKRISAAMVAKRCAARLFTNPLDASNVTMSPESGSWSSNRLIGPRIFTDDEREQLDVIRGVGSGRFSGAAGMT